MNKIKSYWQKSLFHLKKKLIQKAEVISTIQLKLAKSKDAFDLIKVPFNLIIQATETKINGDIEKESMNFKETEFLKSSYQHVITYNIFSKLMQLIEPTKKENQIKILFELIDFDNNKLLSKVFVTFFFIFIICFYKLNCLGLKQISPFQKC